MFPKRTVEVNYDIVIGAYSIIKGDIQSEGSIRVEGKIQGDITSLGNVIISENAFVKGNILSQNADIYGQCHGDVKVKGKINLHHKATLIGDIVAKSFNTNEGSTFKGNCFVDPEEELQINIIPISNNAPETPYIDLFGYSDTSDSIESEVESIKKANA